MNFFSHSGMSTENYDNTLIGFESQSIFNVQLGALGIKYCNGEAARQSLIDNYGWNIYGDAKDCTNIERPFIITCKTTTSDEQITIPTFPFSTTYDYSVDWGDGTISNGHSGDASHIYMNPGTHTVKITGLFPRIYFNDTGDKDKIYTVEQWGSNQWESMAHAFHGCSNLHQLSTNDLPDLSMATDLSYMFAKTTSFNHPIGLWNVSTIENMEGMFYEASIFNQIIVGWDVSNVTNMEEMFRKAVSFDQDLILWDVSKVITMEGIFQGAHSFNRDLSLWNVSNVLKMKNAFRDAHSFNQFIGSWDVSKVKTMEGMFSQAKKFDQDISSWDVSSVINMSLMFNEASIFNQPIGSWDVSKVITMRAMFHSARLFDQDISGWDVGLVEDMSLMFYFTIFNQDISVWNVSNVVDMSYIFHAAKIFDQDISPWNVGNVIDMTGMFLNAGMFNNNLGNWNIGEVTKMNRMFEDAGLCINNYDLTLIAWEAQAVSNLTLDSDGLQFCSSEIARQSLINNYNWTINGDILDCDNINEWIGPAIGSWYDSIYNWSQGHFPTHCEDVIIPDYATVNHNLSDTTIINSIDLKSSGNLILNGYFEFQNNN